MKVYLLSSVAVASATGLVIAFIARRTFIFAVAIGALVSLASIYALQQHQYFNLLSKAQLRVLGEMAQELPAPPRNGVIVVRDGSGHFAHVWTLGPPANFTGAVDVLYGDSKLAVVLCDEVTHQSYWNGVPLRSCPDRKRQTPRLALLGGGIIATTPARRVIFDYDLRHELRLAKPARIKGASRDERFAELLPCHPIQRCTYRADRSPYGAVHQALDGTPMNLVGFLRPNALAHAKFQWTEADRAHLFARLPPRPMQLALAIAGQAAPSVLPTLRVKVNGVRLRTTRRARGAGFIVSAAIPASALQARLDDIELIARTVAVGTGITGAPQRLGLAVERVDIVPTT